MDAIAYLSDQHRELESLFDQLESAVRAPPRARLWRKLVDLLAIHTSIEERIFFPAARYPEVNRLLPRVFEEHFAVERIVADVVALGGITDVAAARRSVLKVCHEEHVTLEEEELFPRMRQLLTVEQLELVGARLQEVADQLLEAGAGARERLAARRAVA
jgi:hemerythrin-like domain-containing protein